MHKIKVVASFLTKIKLIAIGETGLDYHFNYSVELQKKYFLEQIKLANKYELPIIIHSRESQEDVYKILKENVVKKAGIMHCYSGTPEMSKKFIEMGYYLGVGGPVTRYKDVEETVRITSIDKIVIETDSPVLPPEPFEKHSRNAFPHDINILNNTLYSNSIEGAIYKDNVCTNIYVNNTRIIGNSGIIVTVNETTHLVSENSFYNRIKRIWK